MVITPFNLPLAVPAGVVAAALLGGNTVVLKPSSSAPLLGERFGDLLREAGLPVGIFNLLTGSGAALAPGLAKHPDIAGLAFTGSSAAGMELLEAFIRKRPRPCVSALGGKSAAVVLPSAHLEHAAHGVLRSAFGFAGQDCAACSRVYVHHEVARPFLELLLAQARAWKVGDPTAPDTTLGPLINHAAVARFQQAVALGRRQGRLLLGGRVLNEGALARGCFVEPTILDRLPLDSLLFRDELLAPVLAVAEVKSLAAAIAFTNASSYGLAAGVYSQIEEEQIEFFNRVEAGTLFCNRSAGATTGAWPGAQTFGGWKRSGCSGKNAYGPFYLAQFLREQSQTIGH